MVLANFGDNYYLSENPGGVMIVNFLNPLFWVHMVTDGVEQFRSLGRYVWPFYWTLNIFLLVVVHRLFNQGNFPSSAKKILLAIFAIICVINSASAFLGPPACSILFAR